MSDTGRFIKKGISFQPCEKASRELCAKFKDGDQLFLTLWKPRNMAQHRKYFGMLNNVHEACGKWTSAEHLRTDILINLHRYDNHVNVFTGEVTKIPHSMKVASMPRDEFERLYDDTVALLTEYLGCDPQDLFEHAA